MSTCADATGFWCRILSSNGDSENSAGYAISFANDPLWIGPFTIEPSCIDSAFASAVFTIPWKTFSKNTSAPPPGIVRESSRREHVLLPIKIREGALSSLRFRNPLPQPSTPLSPSSDGGRISSRAFENIFPRDESSLRAPRAQILEDPSMDHPRARSTGTRHAAPLHHFCELPHGVPPLQIHGCRQPHHVVGAPPTFPIHGFAHLEDVIGIEMFRHQRENVEERHSRLKIPATSH